MIEKSRLLNPKIASPDTRRRSLRIPAFPKPKSLNEPKPQTDFPKQPHVKSRRQQKNRVHEKN